jgi:hypothetical protein
MARPSKAYGLQQSLVYRTDGLQINYDQKYDSELSVEPKHIFQATRILTGNCGTSDAV